MQGLCSKQTGTFFYKGFCDSQPGTGLPQDCWIVVTATPFTRQIKAARYRKEEEAIMSMLATALRSLAVSASRRTTATAPSASALFSAQHALFSTEAPAAVATAVADAEKVEKKRAKLKIPTKRAAALLQQLNVEAVEKSLVGKEIDNFKPGDSVEVQYLLSRTGGKVQRVKGVVLARRNRGTGSSFIIRNHIGGYGYEQKIFLHSPLLQSVKVLQEAFIHKGKKRVRRASLFYLRDKAPNFTTV